MEYSSPSDSGICGAILWPQLLSIGLQKTLIAPSICSLHRSSQYVNVVATLQDIPALPTYKSLSTQLSYSTEALKSKVPQHGAEASPLHHLHYSALEYPFLRCVYGSLPLPLRQAQAFTYNPYILLTANKSAKCDGVFLMSNRNRTGRQNQLILDRTQKSQEMGWTVRHYLPQPGLP